MELDLDRHLVETEDSDTITLSEEDLTMKLGETLDTGVRGIPGVPEGKWRISVAPGGMNMWCCREPHVDVVVYVNNDDPMLVELYIEGTDIKHKFTKQIPKFRGAICTPFATHSRLKPHFRDGKLNIICKVKFQVNALVVPPSELSVDNFHKAINYAYHTMNEELLKKCRLFFKKLDIANDAAAKERFSSLALIYIVSIITESFGVYEDFEILRLAESKCSKQMMERMQNLLFDQLNLDRFPPAVEYAFDYKNDVLKQKCVNYYVDNIADIKNSDGYKKLDESFVRGLEKLVSHGFSPRG